MSTSHHTLSYLETQGIEIKSILNELNSLYPPINPTPSDNMNSIMYKAGQRSVVEWLLERMEDIYNVN